MTNKAPALFLDRDGVINHDDGYVHRIEDVHYVHGVFDLCRRFYETGHALIVVTNQSGIGRGHFDVQDFERLMMAMRRAFEAAHCPLTAVYHCPHHPDAGCICRKPQPHMLLEAAATYDLDLQRSVMVGDKASDVQAGLAAGVGRVDWLGGPQDTPQSVPTLAAIKPVVI